MNDSVLRIPFNQKVCPFHGNPCLKVDCAGYKEKIDINAVGTETRTQSECKAMGIQETWYEPINKQAVYLNNEAVMAVPIKNINQ